MRLILDNIAVAIVQPIPGLVGDVLTITEKQMVQDEDTYQQKVEFRRRPLYNVLSENPYVIQTYQGLWKAIFDYSIVRGVIPQMYDRRYMCASPDLNSMFGFRFSQKELLTTALQQERSGLIGAPTRYGKTYLMVNTLRAYHNVTTVVTLPGTDLVQQTYKTIKELLPHRDVKLMGAGSRVRYPSEDITVCSMDSLHKCDTGKTELVLIDEPHAVVTDSRLPKLLAFEKARFIGFGATLKGRFDGRDKVIMGAIGPVLAQRTYKEAVAEGAICPIAVLYLKVPLKKPAQSTRQGAYNALLFKSRRMAEAVARMTKELIPEGWQTLIFIKHEKQAELYLSHIGKEGTIAMAKRLSAKERKDLMARMASGEVLRCLASDIYAQGVTFSDVRVLINAAGGGNNTTAIQKPGRLAEIRPGKSYGIVIDFLFTAAEDPTLTSKSPKLKADPRRFLIADSENRKKAYEEIGYEIVECNNREELCTAFSKYSK